MTDSATDELSKRRIMDRIGTEDLIPVLKVSYSEGAMLLSCVLAPFVVGEALGIGTVVQITLSAFGLGLAVTLVRATPPHMESKDWLAAMGSYLCYPDQVYSASESAPREQKNEGGIGRRIGFVSDDRTEDYTEIEEGWLGSKAVLRDDGVIEGWIEVDPGNMDFAMPGDWAEMQALGHQLANTAVVDWSQLKFHATTTEFDISVVIDRLEDRETDDDIERNPVLQELLREYRTERPERFRERGTQQLSFFFGVTVHEGEVGSTTGAKTSLERMAETPLIGYLFRPFVTTSEQLSETEQHTKMLHTLDSRLTTIMKLTQAQEDYAARRLSTAEILALQGMYYNGIETSYADFEQLVRTTPAIQSARCDGVRRAPDPSSVNAEAHKLREVETTDDTTSLWDYFADSIGETDDHGDVDSTSGSEHESSRAEPIRLTNTAEQQKHLLAPGRIDWHTRAAQLGDEWVKTLIIDGYPDYPEDGFLHEVFETTDVSFDMTAYLDPMDQNAARHELKNHADDLLLDADIDNSARSSHLEKQARKAISTSNVVEDGEAVYELAIYVTVRAPTREQLESAENAMRSALSEGANLDPVVWPGKLQQTVPSGAPIGKDRMGLADPDRFKHIALGGGVGALITSLHDPQLIEPEGIEHGLHKELGTPVIVDPFQRENGYAKFVVADPGAGKSHASKAHFLRMVSQREDVMGIVIEPLGNWRGVAEAAGAEHIVIGGENGANPLEISAIPPHARQRMDSQERPLKEKKQSVLALLTNYFGMRNMDLGERRVTLENALDHAYQMCDIYEGDFDSFANESPTITDELTTALTRRERSPEQFSETPAEARRIEDHAMWLRRQLQPFDDGAFASLGGASDFDISDEDMVYLDLAQQEGNVSGEAVLTMQLLVELVYQKAKQTEKKVILAMDEFRYILENAVSLHFMETLWRHHRHHDISPWIMTQTIDEFMKYDESEAILDMCPVKQFHRLEGMDDAWASEFRLNEAQKRYVQTAQPGSDELGYSDALIGIDGDWRKMEIHTLPKEEQVIEFNPDLQQYADLPGVDQTRSPAQSEGTASPIDSKPTSDAGHGAEAPSANGDGSLFGELPTTGRPTIEKQSDSVETGDCDGSASTRGSEMEN
jgi:hypothetical protein